MGPKPLWKRAAALLAAVGMSIFLAGGISADDEIAEAEAARVLKPTQAIADIPQEYNELFEIQWGGGSLYHLKARLATMGCMLNTIWAYDNNRWFSYNQYNVPHSLNQAFITQFKDTIPATTLYGDCYNICDFGYYKYNGGGECLSYKEMHENNLISVNPSNRIDITDTCSNDFDIHIKENVLSFLPLLPRTCVVRKESRSNIRGYVHELSKITYQPFLVLYRPNFQNNRQKDFALNNEIHELCHIQQQYFLVQQLKPHQSNILDGAWYRSKAGRDLSAITQLQFNTNNGRWEMPQDSVYRDIYAHNIEELAAELCAMYITNKTGISSIYDYAIYNNNTNKFISIPIRNTDLSKYLTPQVVEWLERYMVLPYPNVEEEAE